MKSWSNLIKYFPTLLDLMPGTSSLILMQSYLIWKSNAISCLTEFWYLQLMEITRNSISESKSIMTVLLQDWKMEFTWKIDYFCVVKRFVSILLSKKFKKEIGLPLIWWEPFRKLSITKISRRMWGKQGEILLGQEKQP